jgi:hypothetical protein
MRRKIARRGPPGGGKADDHNPGVNPAVTPGRGSQPGRSARFEPDGKRFGPEAEETPRPDDGVPWRP